MGVSPLKPEGLREHLDVDEDSDVNIVDCCEQTSVKLRYIL